MGIPQREKIKEIWDEKIYDNGIINNLAILGSWAKMWSSRIFWGRSYPVNDRKDLGRARPVRSH